MSAAKRVADELQVPLGDYVGYQVRFDERSSRETRLKFMTDGILLADTQGDRDLYQYEALVLDEAHERSLNIDFLLGYLKYIIERRPEFKLIISSATLDAGAFAEFFAVNGKQAPVITAPGQMFPVTEIYLPPKEDEELAAQVLRAVEYINKISPFADTLIFLPGEREIKEIANALEGRKYSRTEVLPLFSRLSMGDQQRVFQPGSMRRLILATNVAETSLTIPRISVVIDSGTARVNRWNPAKGVQRLQVEPISRASSRQRKGRCGRVREGICVRLYEEADLLERAEFTDPEIRRSSLAGVILRMKSLHLPAIEDFPFLDPPGAKAVAEGYRTLREVGALDKARELTAVGHAIARLPVDPRFGRMLIEARKHDCLAEVLPIIAALESNDPRERPSEKTREADAAHARWKDGDSDFIGILRLWQDVGRFREGDGNWKRNALRKYATSVYINSMRVLDWANVHDELQRLIEREWKVDIKGNFSLSEGSYISIHKALLSGVPRQCGLWDKENKAYRSASGGFFAIFPGSGLFSNPKRHEWIMGMELVETTRVWARRVARISPLWVEEVAPHLCHSKFGEAHWDEAQGAVYGKETVSCGSLHIVLGRRVHYGRVDPKAAHQIFIKEGILGNGLRKRTEFFVRFEELKQELQLIEQKLRRPNGLWSDEAAMYFFEQRIPQNINTAAAFHKWRLENEDMLLMSISDVVDEEISLGIGEFPDNLLHEGAEYMLYYHVAPGERDDGVTLGVHVDQLPKLPSWLPAWGVNGNLQERAEFYLRLLPKDFRRACQPLAAVAQGFSEIWKFAPKDRSIEEALSEYINERTGAHIPSVAFDIKKLPEELITKIWICDDDGNELAMGTDVAILKLQLSEHMRNRFEALANESVERSGISLWDGEVLPERVETPGGWAFPALVDEGKTVGVKAFTKLAEAVESHRGGGARLLWLAQADQVVLLTKKFPLGMMARVELPRLGKAGTTIDELVFLSAEGAAGDVFPRSPLEFRELMAGARGRWYEAATKVGQAVDGIVRLLPEIEQWVSQYENDRNWGPVAADLNEELRWMFRPNFVWQAGFNKLCDYPRILGAMRSRISRVLSLPLNKDLEKMERISRVWQPWFGCWQHEPNNPELWSHGWQLEELRIATFAPDAKVIGKISEKRIEDAWAKIVRK